MRKTIALLAILSIAASVAVAQERRWREVHVAVEPGLAISETADAAELASRQYALGLVLPIDEAWSFASTLTWEDWNVGHPACLWPGIACIASEHAPTDGEAAGDITIFPPPPGRFVGNPDVLGLDLVAQYEIPTRVRWHPYVGLGGRVDYVRYGTFRLDPGDGGPIETLLDLETESTMGFSPAVALGFSVPFARSATFRLDGRYYPETWYESSDRVPEEVQEGVRSEAAVRLGVGWRF